MKLDLRYDIGNLERFLNSPYCSRFLILFVILFGFSLFVGILQHLFNFFKKRY